MKSSPQAVRKEVDLNDLPRWSDWPSRLLTNRAAAQRPRTVDDVDREYDKDKYAKALARHRETPAASAHDIRMWDYGPGEFVCVSEGDQLVLRPPADALASFIELLGETMREAIRQARTVVELGCGYGYNLWALHERFPDKTFIGGEYARNAVCLAEALYRDTPSVSVRRFNYYDDHGIADLLAGAEGPIVLYSAHSLEQLPTAGPFLNALLRSGRLDDLTVFHFEPICELYRRDTLIGLLQLRYTEVNSYNTDLLTLLEGHDDVRVEEVRANILSRSNPLNPTSVVRWRPRDQRA